MTAKAYSVRRNTPKPVTWYHGGVQFIFGAPEDDAVVEL